MKIYTINAVDEFDRVFGSSYALPNDFEEDALLFQIVLADKLISPILEAMGTAAWAEWTAGVVEFENVFDLFGGAE